MIEIALNIIAAGIIVFVALFIIGLILHGIFYLFVFILMIFDRGGGQQTEKDEEFTGWEYIERLEKAKREAGGA